MKRVVVLGSTGSIGLSALNIIGAFPKRFKAVALSTHSRVDTLARQCREFNPGFVCVADPAKAHACAGVLPRGTKVFSGEEGLLEMISRVRADIIVMAIRGSAALKPLLHALHKGYDVALANKETLVMAGEIVMRCAARNKARILPVDSEQSAIWQCIEGRDRASIRRVLLTASGGPFRGMSARQLRDVPLRRVLRHPRWKMGQKITVDSATMMNKGLEYIETMMLFNVGFEKIEVVIHPESICHSMVEFSDGIIMAQLSVPDMRIPLYYALAYPERFANTLPSVDFFRLKALHFEKPDLEAFPCLRLAMDAAREGGTLPAVLNASNEVAVDAYVRGRVRFGDIARIVSGVMSRHKGAAHPSLGDILDADAEARSEAMRLIPGTRAGSGSHQSHL